MTLYDLIADIRREHPTQAAATTLDLLMAELGKTRDNLRQAIANIDPQVLPPGGQEILKQLERGAQEANIGNLDYGPPVAMPGFQKPLEPVDEGMGGIAFLLLLSSVVLLGASVAAVVAGLNRIFNWF